MFFCVTETITRIICQQRNEILLLMHSSAVSLRQQALVHIASTRRVEPRKLNPSLRKPRYVFAALRQTSYRALREMSRSD